jgi:hypothetical protein
MLNHNHLKILALLGISLFCSTSYSGDMCTCPKKPKGTECNNHCGGNPGGIVFQEDEPPTPDAPGAPAAADSPYKDKSSKKSSEMGKAIDKSTVTP